MNILIIGVTGTMGKPLASLLASKGHHIVGVARKKPNYDLVDASIEFCIGDSNNDAFMRKVLSMYHYDAIVDFMWRSFDNFVFWFDTMCSSTKQYIVLSTTAVYADSGGIIDECSPRYIDDINIKDNEGEYHIEKARIENYVRQKEYNNWTIVRPHMFGFIVALMVVLL